MAKKRTPRVTQDQLLLAAVLAEPEDDAPRLVYADWLEENDQLHRAEFIRLQLDRARRPYPDSHTPGERETALLAAHRQEWLAALPAWLHGRFEFHRGFPERARRVEMADFPRWDASIWNVAPVIDIRFTDYPAETGDYRPPGEREQMLQALAARPTLGNVRILTLVELGLSAACLEILLASPHLTRLHTLDLGGPTFPPAEMGRVLAGVARLPALRSLNLEVNRIGDEEVPVLLDSPVMGQLTALGLGNSNITDAGAERLASSPHTVNLERLHLYCNRIGDRGALALAASPYLGRLRDLSLMVNDIGAEAQAALRERFGDRVTLG